MDARPPLVYERRQSVLQIQDCIFTFRISPNIFRAGEGEGRGKEMVKGERGRGKGKAARWRANTFTDLSPATVYLSPLCGLVKAYSGEAFISLAARSPNVLLNQCFLGW